MTTKNLFPSFILAALLLGAAAIINWNMAEDYELRFSASGAKGTFSGLQGEIQFDPEQLDQSVMDVKLDASTIETGNNLKNKHARGDKWLHVEKYPEIRFASKSFRKTKGQYEVTGDLTLRGVTRELTIPFTFERTGEGALFRGHFAVNRRDYEIDGPLLGFVVSNEIEVDLRVPVVE